MAPQKNKNCVILKAINANNTIENMNINKIKTVELFKEKIGSKYQEVHSWNFEDHSIKLYALIDATNISENKNTHYLPNKVKNEYMEDLYLLKHNSRQLLNFDSDEYCTFFKESFGYTEPYEEYHSSSESEESDDSFNINEILSTIEIRSFLNKI